MSIPKQLYNCKSFVELFLTSSVISSANIFIYEEKTIGKFLSLIGLSHRNNRQSPLTKNAERNSRGRDWRKEEEEKKEQERREREEKERQEYEEKLKNLSEPEREKLEARRRKFESKVSFLVRIKKFRKCLFQSIKPNLKKKFDFMHNYQSEIHKRCLNRKFAVTNP